MQIVDVLRDHGRHLAGAVEARQREVAAARLGVAELSLHGEAPPPGLRCAPPGWRGTRRTGSAGSSSTIPPGERKSGMPHSVEMPAPVNGRTTVASPTRSCSWRPRFRDRVRSSFRASCFCPKCTARLSPNAVGPTPRVSSCDICTRCCACAISMRRSISIATSSASRGAPPRRRQGRYTLVFLAAPDDDGLVDAQGTAAARRRWSSSPTTGTPRTTARRAISAIWPTRSTTSMRLCERLMKAGVTINRPPRDGMMAFVRSPDQHSIELLQKGEALPPQEPWMSMPNTGHW